MNLNDDQFAELLAGITRSQNALIEAVERALPGFKNTHAIPVLNVAANIRAAEPRMLDLPSRILLRMQGRATIDVAAIKHDLARLTGEETRVSPPPTVPAAPPSAPAAPAPATGGPDLDFIKS